MEPEDVQDYDSLRRYFALDAALAAVDDVAKWLVGLAGALGAVGSGLGLTTVGAKLSSGDHVAIILLAISFILAVLGRMPLLISVNRRSVVSMKRTAGRLLGFRGTVIVLSASVFMAALITAAASS